MVIVYRKFQELQKYEGFGHLDILQAKHAIFFYIFKV